ncbi:MAG: hypothetical protein ABI690_32265 [Chloroflexota bacterium]
MNTNPRASHLLILSERVYRALLILYPANFRRDYGQHMAQVFRDVCRDRYRQGGAEALAKWWAAALFDLLQTIISEHRKAGFTLSKDKFIHWSGWLCIFGGVFFAASSLSQLQTGSQTYSLSIAAVVPGLVFITLGLLGIFLRYNPHINLFGRLALLATLIGAAIATVGWLLTITISSDLWGIFLVGWLVYLAGHSVFGGFAATTRLLPKWNYAMLIGSALPLTILVLWFDKQATTGADWGAFAMFLLIGIGWLVTGVALNSQPSPSLQPAN